MVRPADETRPGQYAASWSQRLIFAYIGGRVFLDAPVLGTGWWGELPPQEYARFLARRAARFSDQPPHYFPPADGPFIPQQTFDQVLYELGVVGVALFLALGALTRAHGCASAAVAARRRDELAAYLPAAWLGVARRRARRRRALRRHADRGALLAHVRPRRAVAVR